jgi:hypothetical protein
VKLKVAFYLPWFLLFGMVVAAANARAQTIAYRQIDLTSNVPDLANNLSPDLVNPWGLAFLPGKAFFIANNGNGRITTYDFTGLGVAPSGFTVPNAAGL